MRLVRADRAMMVAALTLVLWTSAARAQTAYVAASLGADIGRTGSSDGSDAPGTGEALSFSLRVGTGLISRFGVELDFTRPSEIETDESPDIGVLDARNTIASDLSRLLPGVPILPLPIVGYTTHTAQRTTTITGAAWVRQEISPRISLVYLGGVAFGRIQRTVATSLDGLPVSDRPTLEYRTSDYSAGPMAGFEGRLGLTEHAQVVPGIRVLSVGDGWIIRPAVSLSWVF